MTVLLYRNSFVQAVKPAVKVIYNQYKSKKLYLLVFFFIEIILIFLNVSE